MANTLDKIEVVTDYKHLQIREVTDSGGYHRRVLTPDEDVSSEVSAIQEKNLFRMFCKFLCPQYLNLQSYTPLLHPY